MDVFREEKLIVAILGENHQIFMFPAIIERVVGEAIKIEETKTAACSVWASYRSLCTHRRRMRPGVITRIVGAAVAVGAKQRTCCAW